MLFSFEWLILSHTVLPWQEKCIALSIRILDLTFKAKNDWKFKALDFSGALLVLL
jgi:hypothetical protein